jgi:hypothetical protein
MGTKDGLERAAKALLPAPLKAAVELLSGTLAPASLSEVATETLQQDVVRLYQMMLRLRDELGSDISSKMDPVEALELITQTFDNMQRTARSERRALMANVLVNGLRASAVHPSFGADERRFFVRALADLDMLHIDLLHRYEKGGLAGLTELEQAARWQLEARSLVSIERASAFGGKVGVMHEAITDLGRRFLDYLRSPL